MTPYTSVRFWTKRDPSPFAHDLVKLFNDKGCKVANFDNYGDDGSSYRLDLRFKGRFKKDLLQGLVRKEPWKSRLLLTEIQNWNEPDLVKEGHDMGSLLALRFKKYGKVPETPMMLTFTLTLLLSRWGSNIGLPYWQREYIANEKALLGVVEFMLRGVPRPNMSFTIVERTVHNFLNNFGATVSFESRVWGALQFNWWITKIAGEMGEFGRSAPK